MGHDGLSVRDSGCGWVVWLWMRARIVVGGSAAVPCWTAKVVKSIVRMKADEALREESFQGESTLSRSAMLRSEGLFLCKLMSCDQAVSTVALDDDCLFRD